MATYKLNNAQREIIDSIVSAIAGTYQHIDEISFRDVQGNLRATFSAGYRDGVGITLRYNRKRLFGVYDLDSEYQWFSLCQDVTEIYFNTDEDSYLYTQEEEKPIVIVSNEGDPLLVN